MAASNLSKAFRLLGWLTVVALALAVLVEARVSYLRRVYQTYELHPFPHAIDVNGDGIDGAIFVTKEGHLVVEDSGRRLLDLLYNGNDSTFRTHIAARRDRGQVRLIVFDTGQRAGIVRDVYAWDGNALVPVDPTAADERIFTALAARDDHGTFHFWLFWWVASKFLALTLAWFTFVAWISASSRR